MKTRLVLAALVAVAAAPAPAPASGYDYTWALPEWRATWAAPRFAEDRGFAVEATGDAVYVAGLTGSQGGQGVGDLFLLRYSPVGTLEWSRTWGGFDLDQAQSIAVDDAGVWVAGAAASGGATRFALLKFSHAGDLLVARTWGHGILDVLRSVAVRDGGVYVAGFTSPSRSDRNVYVARLDAAGDEDWFRIAGSTEFDEAWDVAVDANRLYVAGYSTAPVPAGLPVSQATLAAYTHDGTPLYDVSWGGPSNDEARALALDGDDVWLTGGAQSGRSTDVFVARRDAATGGHEMLRTTGGAVVGGGGYGIALGAEGVYVAGGSYDFPAGGDAAVLRFDADGNLQWRQVIGLPGFWDWGFDVAARDGRFYVTGVLYKPGGEWYSVLTLGYREDFPTATLTRTAQWAADGHTARAQAAMDHFWMGDFLRWAEDLDASDAGTSRIDWEGASDYGREYGRIWIDSDEDPPAGQDNAAEAILGLRNDLATGANTSLVRDFTGLTGSLAGGFVRFRYYISHDSLIPQGGYLYVGEFGTPLPPPPV